MLGRLRNGKLSSGLTVASVTLHVHVCSLHLYNCYLQFGYDM